MSLIRSASTRTLFLGIKIVSGRAKIFVLVYFSPSSLLISKKKEKKVIVPIWSTFLSEFSVDLQKKGHLAKLLYYLLVFCRFPRPKGYRLETAARERGVWVGMLGILGGGIFVRGALPPRSYDPVNTNMYRAR